MPKESKFYPEENILRVRAFGDITIEDMDSARDEVTELNRSHGTTKFLVNVSEQLSAPAMADLIDFAGSWPVDVRCAMVTSGPTTDDHEFLETAALNRGRSMKNFATVEEAESWLKEKD